LFCHVAAFILRGKSTFDNQCWQRKNKKCQQLTTVNAQQRKNKKTNNQPSIVNAYSFLMPVNVILCFMSLLHFNDIAGWLFFVFAHGRCLLLGGNQPWTAFRWTLVGSMPPCLQMNAIVTRIHCMKHHMQMMIRLLCKEHFGVMYTIGYQNKKTIGRWWQSNGFI